MRTGTGKSETRRDEGKHTHTCAIQTAAEENMDIGPVGIRNKSPENYRGLSSPPPYGSGFGIDRTLEAGPPPRPGLVGQPHFPTGALDSEEDAWCQVS